MIQDSPSVLSIIRQYIVTDLLGMRVDLADDALLIQEGYLTSLQTVELVGFLSDRFEIEIEPEEVNEDEFRSLRTIASLVIRKTASLDD